MLIFVGLITSTEIIQKKFQCNLCDKWSNSYDDISRDDTLVNKADLTIQYSNYNHFEIDDIYNTC